MYLVGNRNTDSEYGDYCGLLNLAVFDTKEEAETEVQKRMEVSVYHRKGQWYVDNWGGEGCQICVNQPAQLYEIIDGKVIVPDELSRNAYGPDYSYQEIFVIGATPVYEEDPRGRHWNHKILRYEFKEPETDLI